MKTKKILVDPLARVEGEGVLYVKIRDGKLEDIKFKIIEPPRFFEALLRGRMYTEAPDITARICGICPVAYQMSTVHALEDACDVVVAGQLRALRRLLYCGEWIESHVLHIFMLHAPDFLGYPDVMHLAQDYPEHVKRALQLKKTGNGQEMPPWQLCVGPHSCPSRISSWSMNLSPYGIQTNIPLTRVGLSPIKDWISR